MALKRYDSAMATIQIREVPEEAYEVIRRRARAAGQSIQAYMRDQVVAMAARPSKEEAVANIEAILSRLGGPGPSVSDIIDDLRADRR
jgi:plasmid stability protein